MGLTEQIEGLVLKHEQFNHNDKGEGRVYSCMSHRRIKVAGVRFASDFFRFSCVPRNKIIHQLRERISGDMGN